MNRIFLTGDTHGEIDIKKLTSKCFPEGNQLDKNDYVIILGDFGFIWNNVPDKQEAYWMKWFMDKPWTTLFIDGNHSNFQRLQAFEVTQWNGGNVHIINDSVIHLMRGQIFYIAGRTIFTFGGAESYDKAQRTAYISWWPEEIPSYKEMNEGIDNVQKIDKVDYILTHTAPYDLVTKTMGYTDCTDPTAKMLNWYMQNVNFKHWFFGHWHLDKDYGSKFSALYNSIVEVK